VADENNARSSALVFDCPRWLKKRSIDTTAFIVCVFTLFALLILYILKCGN